MNQIDKNFLNHLIYVNLRLIANIEIIIRYRE